MCMRVCDYAHAHKCRHGIHSLVRAAHCRLIWEGKSTLKLFTHGQAACSMDCSQQQTHDKSKGPFSVHVHSSDPKSSAHTLKAKKRF